MSIRPLQRLAADTARSFSNEVLLTSVPLSVTLNDIKALSYKAAKPGSASSQSSSSSVRRDSSTSSLAAGISSIEFARTPLLNMSGKVIVKLRNAELAREFANTANGKWVGGNQISAQQGIKVKAYSTPSTQLLADFQKRSPGRIVMIKGIPAHMNEVDLLKILGTNYKLAEDAVTIDGEDKYWAIKKVPDMHSRSSVSTFLVRCQTVADAMMMVSRWHRVVWRYRNVVREAAWERRNGFKKEDTDDGDDLLLEESQSSTPDRYRGNLGDEEISRGQDDEGNFTPMRTIIDAYIMPETTVYFD